MSNNTDLITDGADTLDLQSSTDDMLMQMGAYVQLITQNDGFGRFGVVEERFLVLWTGDDHADRGDDTLKIERLQAKARLWSRRNWRYGPVWRKQQHSGEGSARYALVYDIRIELLPPDVLNAEDGKLRGVELVVVREGAWRDAEPSSGGGFTTIEGPATWNEYTDNDFGVADMADVDGYDRPPLMQLGLSFTWDASGHKYANFLIGKKTGALTPLNGFNPEFNGNDADVSSIYAALVVDSNSPGGNHVRINVTTGTHEVPVTWDITSPEYYTGQYLTFVELKIISAGSVCQMSLLHGVSGARVATPFEDITSLPTGQWLRLPLGRISMPSGGELPPGESLAGDYKVEFSIGCNATTDVRVRRLRLMPIDEGVMTIRGLSNPSGATDDTDELIIDGHLNHAYMKSNGNVVNAPINYSVPIPTLGPQALTRFYYHTWYTYTSGGVDYMSPYDGLVSVDGTLKMIGRVSALKGNN